MKRIGRYLFSVCLVFGLSEAFAANVVINYAERPLTSSADVYQYDTIVPGAWGYSYTATGAETNTVLPGNQGDWIR
jgi:hypothetical protein